MPASKEQRRTRYLRKVRRRAARTSDQPKKTDTRQQAYASAAAEKRKRLLELEQEYAPRIATLEEEWAEKRREVWADYDERKALVSQAVILGDGE
jgi:hypothetical protein